MIVLDHNIPEDQVEQLRRWRIHCKQVGFEVGRPECDDQQEILRYLHSVRNATFFTRDLGFFRSSLCRANYSLIILNLPVLETARSIRKLLRHPDFRSKSSRAGKVIRAKPDKVTFWEIGTDRQKSYNW